MDATTKNLTQIIRQKNIVKVFKISAITLSIENMEKSCKFYQRIPGFKIVYGGLTTTKAKSKEDKELQEWDVESRGGGLGAGDAFYYVLYIIISRSFVTLLRYHFV